MKKLLFSIIIFCFFKLVCQADNSHKIDSLQALLRIEKRDTAKVNQHINLAIEYDNIGDFYSAMISAKSALQLSNSIIFKGKKGWDIGIANSYNSIGSINASKGNYADALKNYLASLKIREKIKDKNGIAGSLNNIGGFYLNQGNLDEALRYFTSSLIELGKIGNKNKIASTNLNIGLIYLSQNKTDKALEFFLSSLQIFKEIENEDGIARSQLQIGTTYMVKENYEKALINIFDALKIFEKNKNNALIAGTQLAIANVYLNQNKIAFAKQHLYHSLEIAKKIGSNGTVVQAYQLLSICDAQIKNWKGAFENQVLYKQYNDSVFNMQSTNKSATLMAKYASDKKEVEIKAKATAEQEKLKAIAEAKSKKQKLIIVFITGGLLFVAMFAGFVVRSLRIRNKQNKIITEQKALVEEKNRDILDSIEYALRIQTAILPPQKIVKQYLENSFILYKPKDIVAGDFYWMETIELADVPISQLADEKNQQINTSANQLILFAACDCTGHGVPGAMVSVVCHNALNRAVREFGLTEPASILNKTAEIVVENFSKSEEDIKDGMDISLCSLNTKTKELQWAGANNPLWIVKRMDNEKLTTDTEKASNFPLSSVNFQLLETKADKQPIGMNEDHHPFTNQTFTLGAGDTIYIFTDGFADQFGGDTGEKKLTRKRFKEQLVAVQHLSLPEQGIALDKFIVEYQKEVAQVDDILVMGVRV